MDKSVNTKQSKSCCSRFEGCVSKVWYVSAHRIINYAKLFYSELPWHFQSQRPCPVPVATYHARPPGQGMQEFSEAKFGWSAVSTRIRESEVFGWTGNEAKLLNIATTPKKLIMILAVSISDSCYQFLVFEKYYNVHGTVFANFVNLQWASLMDLELNCIWGVEVKFNDVQGVIF